MIELFDITDVNQSASSFNADKLLWLNQQHIISAPRERIGAKLIPFLKSAGLDPDAGPAPEDVAEGFRERAETLLQMASSARYCYEDFDAIDAKAAKKNLRPVILVPMTKARKQLANLSEWTKQGIAKTIEDVAASCEINLGKLGQPIRVAVTGGSVSPPIDVTIWLVGRERTLRRMDHAIELIKERAAAG
jgi:glutamyl-tRNA synthetase